MRIRSVLATACLVCFAITAVFTHVSTAEAHANYVRSLPQADSASLVAPQFVQVWFSETVDPAASLLTVHDAAGVTVDTANSRLAPGDPHSLIVDLRPLNHGTYTVIWTTLSAVDGHSAKGSFPFTVGEKPDSANYSALVEQMKRAATALQPPPLADTIVRWLTYLALALVAGGFVYTALLLPATELDPLDTRLTGRRRLFLWTGLGILAATITVGVVVRIAETGVTSAISGRFGVVMICRLVLAAILATILWRKKEASRLVVVPCALLLISQSMLSHGAAETNWLVPATLDWLHLTAVSIWLGGVAMLAFVIAPYTLAIRPQLKSLGLAVNQFSSLAVGCVVVIYLTGIVQSITFLGNADALFSTAYGRVLLVKIALAIVLIGFGAFHQLFIGPDLKEVKGKLGKQAQRSGNQFRTSIMAEAIVSLVILVVAGGLTSLAPGRDLTPSTGTPLFVQSKTGTDLSMLLGLTPARVGSNQFAVVLTDISGSPALDVDNVVLRFTSHAMDMGESELVLQPYDTTDAAIFTAQSGVLSMDGQWQVELIARRNGKPDERTQFSISPK